MTNDFRRRGFKFVNFSIRTFGAPAIFDIKYFASVLPDPVFKRLGNTDGVRTSKLIFTHHIRLYENNIGNNFSFFKFFKLTFRISFNSSISFNKQGGFSFYIPLTLLIKIFNYRLQADNQIRGTFAFYYFDLVPWS